MVFITDEQYEIAKNNGINKRIVYKRVYDYGWSVEDAITKKIMNKAECRMKYPKYIYDKLKENDIPLGIFHSRLFNGWELEDAYSIPRGTVRYYKKWRKANGK